MQRTKRSVMSDNKEPIFTKQRNNLKRTVFSDLTQCSRIQVYSVSEVHSAPIFRVEE
jgi:hypothetical protein